MDLLLDTAWNGWLLAADMAPYLLLGFLVAGLLHVFVPRQWVHRQLGAHSAWSVVKGALLGAPLPLCSCGVLPVAASLKKSGASPPAVLSFLIATPVTGVDSILATYAMLGGLLAVVRPIASVALALLSGLFLLIALRPGREEQQRGGPGAASTPPPAVAAGARPGLLARLRTALVFALSELPAGIAGSLLAGLAAGAVIATLLPADALALVAGAGWLSYLAMAAVGTPLYMCATGSIPIAAALMAKGLSPGAALVLMLAGPATNTVAIAVARELVGRRGLAIYLGTVVIGSLLAGALTDWLAGPTTGLPGAPLDGGCDSCAPDLPAAVSGALLLALCGGHLARRWGRRLCGRAGEHG